MAYRFTIGTTQVECDALEELLRATLPRTFSKPGERAGRPGDGRKVKSPKHRKQTANRTSHNWALAKAWSAKYGIPVNEARKLVKKPENAAAAEKLLAKSK